MASKKQKASYVCNSCGSGATTWSGKCFSCGEWGTVEEVSIPTSSAGKAISGSVLKGVSITKAAATMDQKRLDSGMNSVNEVLGGGFVRGSVVLLAGPPGVGKSTLLMQLASNSGKKHKVMYVSGEESAHQVASRALRLGLDNTKLEIASSTSANDIISTIHSSSPELMVVDSIQTISAEGATGVAGGVSQIVNSTHMLVGAAKHANTALVIVGHVTKEGNIAGPKLLEHLVDVVLQLEGDKFAGFKLLRAAKNRYGSTDEVSVLEMTAKGLEVVKSPSAALLEERLLTDGSVVFAAMEGSKPLLVEIQALTNKTNFGYPKRTAVGFSQNRLNLLVAVLEKRTKLDLSQTDIYVSVASGMNINEPGADLAVCMAIASSVTGLALSKSAVVYGEVGLGGEIRQVMHADKRSAEAAKLGFTTVIGPASKSNKSGVRDLRAALTKYLAKK